MGELFGIARGLIPRLFLAYLMIAVAAMVLTIFGVTCWYRPLYAAALLALFFSGFTAGRVGRPFRLVQTFRSLVGSAVHC